MNNKLTFKYLFSILIIGLLFSSNVYSSLVLTSPPRESAEKGEKLYGPIAKMMSEALGEKVVYQHPDDWMEYSTKMRAGKYDIVFDGPHFAAWRIKHLDHKPIARLPGTLDFVVITKKNNKRMSTRRGILRGSICGLASPHLATVSILAEYQDSITVPKIVEIKGGPKAVLKSYKQGKCDAAVLRLELWKNLPKKVKKDSRVVYTTESLPNQTITVSPRVSEKNHARIAKLLRSKKGAKSSKHLLNRFSKKARYFIKIKQEEFKDLEKLLEGVVFGW